MYLWLIRHGAGWPGADGALTPAGQEQARAVAGRLAGAGLTHLVSSPLARALGTASIAGLALGLPVAVWPELREGASTAEPATPPDVLGARFPGARPAPGPWPATYAAETYSGFYARAAAAWTRLQATFASGDRVAVFAHGGLINVLLHVVLGIPPAAPGWFEVKYPTTKAGGLSLSPLRNLRR